MQLVAVDLNLLGRFGVSLTPRQWTIAMIVVAVFAVGIGVWSIFRLRAWFREDAGRADDNLEMLTQFRDLHRQGGLSEDEYRLIKSRLVAGRNPQSTAGQGSPTSAKTADRARLANGIDRPHDGTDDESSTIDKPPTMEADRRDMTDRDHTTKDGSGKSPDESH